MSFLDLAARLKLVIEELNSTREQESILIGKETIALVRLRVQNSKENEFGQPFGQYSEALVPQWMYYGKSLSDGAEDKIRQGDWFQSYADFREANNLDSEDIDFTFSGDMWRNTGVKMVQSSGAQTVVIVGGQTTRAQDIIDWQEERYGNIIAINEEEERFVIEAHEERVFGIIEKFL